MYAPLVAIPLVLVLPGRRFGLLRKTRWPAGRRPLLGLVWKAFAENGALHALSLVFIVTVALATEMDAFLTLAGGTILVTALGTAAYDASEKEGLRSVLYDHPVPREHLFWAKIGVGLVPVVAVSVGVFLHWSRQAPVPLATALAFGVFAYAVSVLITLAIQRESTALLAAECLVAGAAATPLILADLFRPASGLPPGDETSALLLVAAPSYATLAAGCLAGAWWAATNRTVLTGSARYRLAFAGRLLGALAAVALLVGAVGWSRL